MGEATFVRPGKNSGASTVPHSLRLRIDVPLLLIVITLLAVGLAMVYSASWDLSNSMGKPANYMFLRQFRFAFLGIAVAIGLFFFNYHMMRRLMIPMMLVVLAGLVAVLIIGNDAYGSRSLLGGSIQPAELAKAAIIIYLSFWLYSKRDQLDDISLGLFPAVVIIGGVSGLVLIQPDISAAGTIFILGMMMFFLAGGKWRQLILVFMVAIIFGYLVILIFPKASDRINEYLLVLQDPVKGSYHIRRSLEAVVKGGFFGVGIGNADTKYTGLPLPVTDSIFAIIAEETGVLGSLGVVLLYIMLVWRGITIARRAPDQLGALLAGGLSIWLGIEAMINMTVIVGLFPFAGNTLPFISYGGSSLVVSLASIGIIMNVARQGTDQELNEGRSFSAVVNLRRGNGRRSVSRARRSTGHEQQG